jgi:hypothetical protein
LLVANCHHNQQPGGFQVALFSGSSAGLLSVAGTTFDIPPRQLDAVKILPAIRSTRLQPSKNMSDSH